MKANEIMIGDKLKTVFSQKIVEVKEIKQNCIYTEDNGYEYNEIEPIPLTPEILEKNGLEKDNHGRLYGEYFDEDINRDLEITVDSKTGEVWWSYNWDEYWIIRLKYVHQLQHALRLCGIDKTIEL
jgi:hypothetical protein